MKQFHSPLLANMPIAKQRPSLKTVGWRVALSLFVLFLLWLCRWLFLQRWFTDTPLLNLAYQFHDHIFLPFKAIAYTLYYPLSCIFWGVVLTLLLLSWASFISGRSFITGPHIALLTKVVHAPALHPFLLQMVKWLHRLFRYPHILLRKTVKKERMLAKTAVLQHPTTTKSTAHNQLRYLTHLQMELTQILAPHQTNLLTRAYQWHETIVLLSLKQTNLKESNFLKRAPTFAAPSPLQTEHPLSATALLTDLVYLLHCLDETYQPHQRPPHHPHTTKQLLAQSVERRLHKIEGILRHLQQLHTQPTPSARAADTLDIPADLQAVHGQLSLTIAVHIAQITQSPYLALNYFELYEALILMGNLLEPTTIQIQALQRLEPIQRQDYKILTLLLTPTMQQQQNAWQAITNYHDNNDLADDLAMSHAILTHLQLATGPDFETS